MKIPILSKLIACLIIPFLPISHFWEMGYVSSLNEYIIDSDITISPNPAKFHPILSSELVEVPNNKSYRNFETIIQSDTTLNCQGNYSANDNIVVIEAENLSLPDGWQRDIDHPGFTGSGFISWNGGNLFNTPGNGLITTEIDIKEPGIYHFQWRNKVGQGTDFTESNDSWVRFPDADDFYGRNDNGNIVYPHGSGKTPLVIGSGSDGWFKVYSNTPVGSWSWSCLTNDGDGHHIYVAFNNPGVYTMEISGRSNYHLIDRIVLSKDSQQATDLSLQETICDYPLNSDEKFITVDSDSAFEGEKLEFLFHLNKPSDNQVIAEIGIINETTDYLDYNHSIEPIVFEPGHTTATKIIQTYVDDNPEIDESFKIVVTEIRGDNYEIMAFAKGLIKELSPPKKMRVQPNPSVSNGTIRIAGLNEGEYEIGIYSIGGEMVSQKKLAYSGEFVLRLPSMSKGIYIIRADTKTESYASKIVIE